MAHCYELCRCRWPAFPWFTLESHIQQVRELAIEFLPVTILSPNQITSETENQNLDKLFFMNLDYITVKKKQLQLAKNQMFSSYHEEGLLVKLRLQYLFN